MKVCIETGCPTLTNSTRCIEHTRAKDKARGTRQQRGYDSDHEAERRAWLPIVALGTVTCRRASSGTCRADSPTISPDEPWDLGHPDDECPARRAPEHRACNRATSARRPA